LKSAVQVFRKLIKPVIPRRLRPERYLQEKVKAAAAGRVISGPFCGMKYVDRSYCSGLYPKLLGVYERELHPIIEQACAKTVDRVVDIGSAEGYYAVGFAYRRPSIPVIAFEMDADARRACQELARLNDLTDAVDLRAACDSAALAEAIGDLISLVMCDCEGAEAEIMDPVKVPALQTAYVLVETHDFVIPGLTERIRNRFAATHEIKEIWQQDRGRGDFPLTDWYIRRLPDQDLRALLNEHRPERMRWLWMEPKVFNAGSKEA
jgi:hypothetical protein